MTFKGRLEAAKRRGNLRDADLARWFGRRQSTIAGWLDGREPSGTPADLRGLFSELTKLEGMIEAKRLPLSQYASAPNRIAYLEKLKRGRACPARPQ